MEMERKQEERRDGASLGPGILADSWTVLSDEYETFENRIVQEFRTACIRNPGRNVHLVQNANGTLLWHATEGSSDAISKFVVPWSEDCKKPFTATCKHEMSAVECSQRVCLLLGEPGIGKTSFLCSLAERQREKAPEAWAVVVKLLDHVDVLADLQNTKEMDTSCVASLLAAAAAGVATPASTAARLCLEAALFHTGAVHVYVDGVDEVMPTYREVALRLLKLLVKETNAARVWVAARSEVDASLRRMLPCCLFTLFLLPLSRDEQLVYLRSKWSLPDQRQATDAMERLANELVSTFAFAPGLGEEASQLNELDRRSLLGVPLNLRLVAGAFAKDIKIAIESNGTFLPKRVNQLDIFERFIENQRERYKDRYEINHPLRRITNSSKADDDEFLSLHLNFAMLVWASATVPSEQKLFQEYVEKYKENLSSEKTGILWQLEDGRIQFAHYTFVEYLVAKWLFENHKKSSDYKQLFEAAYAALPRSRIMVFLDLMLAEGLPVHRAIIENDTETLHLIGIKDPHKDLGGRSTLHVAAAYGRLTCLYMLLEAGCDLSRRDSLLKWTALRYASATEKLVTAEILLEQGAEEEDLEIRRDIIQVLKFDLVKVLRIFLKRMGTRARNFKISVNCVSNDSELSLEIWPLHFAAEAGSRRVVRLLLEYGVDINSKGVDGDRPIHAAVQGGHEDMVDLLLSHGADVRCRGNNGFTALHYACVQGHEKVMELLVKKCTVLINSTTARNYTPLHVAAYQGKKEIVEFLVAKGANLMSQSDEGHMPIHLAARAGHEGATEVLLNRGANIHCRGKNECTPLHYACEGGHEKVVQVLLSKGADVSLEAHLNTTPMLVAAEKGHKDVVKLPLSSGAVVECRDLFGRTPLYAAASNGHVLVVQLLLTKGADANVIAGDGSTPLHGASWFGSSRVVVVLLHAGAPVNACRIDGKSALHLAATQGHRDIVELLLSRGADAYQMDGEGCVPIQYAISRQHTAVVEILLRESFRRASW